MDFFFLFLVDVSDIFYYFLLGEWEVEVRGREGGGGGSVFIENPRRGGVFPGREGPRGRKGLQRIGELGEGGCQIFFFGPKCPPSFVYCAI